MAAILLISSQTISLLPRTQLVRQATPGAPRANVKSVNARTNTDTYD